MRNWMRALVLMWAAAALAAVSMAVAQTGRTPPKTPPLLPHDPGVSGQRAPFRAPKPAPIPLREMPALRVDRVEAHVLREGTHAGAAGDVLITLHGQGFMETSRAPRLEIGPLVIDETMASADGARLFAVLSPEQRERLSRATFDRITVVNPGALERADGRSTLRASSADVRPTPGAGARLVFRGGFFERELSSDR